MSDDQFDLIVIGGGPGGYVAAIRAAQLDMRVACIDKRGVFGGTCLNVGCIPSKALLHSSALYAHARNGLAGHGVTFTDVGLDLSAMMARKDKVVGDLTKGIGFLLKKNEVTPITGSARINAPGRVTVGGRDGEQQLSADHILIATGSEPMPLPGVDIDEKRIVSSTGALALDSVPGHLVVVGGGYIGLEMGSVWRRLGAEVTVVEFLDTILPAMDAEVATTMQRALKKQGITFRLGTKVLAGEASEDAVALALEPAGGGQREGLAADVVLVAIGRRPYTDGLGLEDAGVARDNRGFITVDDAFKTSVDGIYAIGDAVPGPMLAHQAEEEGIACVERIAGQAGHVNYGAIPGVVYTHPEAASVGRTEQELAADGIDYAVGKFPFSANSRARAMGETEGFVKILADAASDAVLGVHIVGPEAGTLIAELALAIEFGASAEDVARTCHAHPTLNEAVKESALAVAGRAIHA